MAHHVNDSKSTTGSSSAAAAGNKTIVSPYDFLSSADASSRTWLSLGSYEEVFNSDFYYWSVHKALSQCNMKLEKILKIHNDILRERFEEEVNLLKKRRGSGFEPNIQELYHGTSESVEKICHEGLDERLSTAGHFGRGIYFSDGPEICRVESEAVPRDKHFIVSCKVILGDCKVYPSGVSDPSLTREPVKEIVDGKNVFYDSVQGKPGNFKQYVVYEKRRALLQYVIFYTTDGPLPTLPPIPSTKSSTRKKASKSTEKRSRSKEKQSRSTEKRSQSKESRSSSIESHSSDGSVSSLHNDASSGGSCSDDDGLDCSGATGGVTASGHCTNKKFMKNQAIASQHQIDADESAPKSLTTGNRTRHLLSQDTTSTVPVNEATSKATSLANTDTDHMSEAYKRNIQENAMKQMLNLKGKISDHQMDELYRCYSQTYAGMELPSTQQTMSSDSDDVQTVINSLVAEFMSLVGNIDQNLAFAYVLENDMDINKAISAYFDNI